MCDTHLCDINICPGPLQETEDSYSIYTAVVGGFVAGPSCSHATGGKERVASGPVPVETPGPSHSHLSLYRAAILLLEVTGGTFRAVKRLFGWKGR